MPDEKPGQSDAHKWVLDIRVRCTEEWKTDYRMIEYCEKRQMKGLQSVLQIARDETQGATRTRILMECMIAWKAGDSHDWRMVEYCYNRKAAAYSRLSTILRHSNLLPRTRTDKPFSRSGEH